MEDCPVYLKLPVEVRTLEMVLLAGGLLVPRPRPVLVGGRVLPIAPNTFR